MSAALHRDHWPPVFATASRLFSVERKRPWDDETQKVGQLMMAGHCRRATLDLFERTYMPSRTESDGLEELESHAQLPCGWEKFLDLQTGELYYKNRITGRISPIEPSERDDKHDAIRIETLCADESRKESGMNECKLDLTLNLGSNDVSRKDVENMEAVGDALGVTQDKHSERRTQSLHPVKHEKPKCAAAHLVRSANSCETSMSSTSSTGISQELGATQISWTSGSRKSPAAGDDDQGRNAGTAYGKAEMMEIVGCPGCLMYVMRYRTEEACPICGSSILIHFSSHKRLRTS